MNAEKGPAPLLHEYSGAIHIHSTFSDGKGDVRGIMSAAARAGVDFVVLTDHNSLAAKPDEGWHTEAGRRALLIVGQEVTPDKEHYLAFGLDRVIPARLGESARYVAEVAERGGLGFIAHPYDLGNPRLGVPSYEWRPAPEGPFTGIEVWNYYSEWLGRTRSYWSGLRSLIFPRAAAPPPPQSALALWDGIGRSRAVSGIGGLDAHGSPDSGLGRRFRAMTYDFAFRALRTNVLLDRPLRGPAGDDVRAVLAALGRGRATIVDALRGPSRGVRFWGRRGGGASVLLPGDDGSGPVTFELSVPATARLRILRDGRLLAEGTGRSLSARSDGPGVYRAEAHRWRGGWRPWVFTNPIYLRG